jgi:hypothetical protein
VAGKRILRQRPRRREEQIALIRGAAQWMYEGIDRYDRGDDLGIELVASRLRLLFGSDEALPQFCDRFRIDHPLVAIGEPAANDDAISLAIGALPADDGQAVKLRKMADARCLVVDDGVERVVFRWRDLVNDAANTLLGVHAAPEVATIFDEITSYHFGDVPAVPFLLRTAGVAVLKATKEVLAAAGADDVLSQDLSYEVNGARVFAVQIRGRF